MRPSLQLLYSKGVVMDCAALMIPGDLGNTSGRGGGGGGSKKLRAKAPPVRLGAERGFCGGEEDVARAEQLAVQHAEMTSMPRRSSTRRHGTAAP